MEYATLGNYGSPGFETLFRNHDVQGWQRTLQGHPAPLTRPLPMN
jgi:hypothetical protein